MNFWTALCLATACLIATVVIFATKFLYPYHRIVALIVYGIGWIPFLYSISLKKQSLLHHQATVSSFFSAYWIHIIFGIILFISIYVFLILFPVEKSPFIGLSDEEISRHLHEDETLVLYIDDRFANLFASADEQGVFQIDFKDPTNVQKAQLDDFWISYLETIIELDLLKERYKTFTQLNAATKPNLHRQAFQNGYTALLSQHYYTLQLQERVANNTSIKTFLNEQRKTQGIDGGTYDMILSKLTDPDELIRLNTGRAYNAIISDSTTDISVLISEYLAEVDANISTYTNLIAKKPLNFFERNSYNLWIPVQTQSAIQISYIRTTSREYHIPPEQAALYREKLQPGDILLERREWHATNVGIPGYWTHSALYMGTLEYLDEHFAELPALEGKTFSEYTQTNYPAAYDIMQKTDEGGFEYSVIESKRPGVILMSLEASANADSVGVLRVKELTKEDQFKIVTQALAHLGKPYDYDFDFVTDNALVCSELVYKAYQDITQLSIEPQEFNGRLIVSPNQFAQKFSDEMELEDSELELVFFLDGNEKEGVAVEKGTDEFSTSWQRPKWHIANDFIAFE